MDYIMKVGDLVQIKEAYPFGYLGVITDWEEDYHHKVVFVVMFPANTEMDGHYPEEELEVVCK